MNLTTPDDFDIHASFDIDYGEYLLVKDRDFWDVPVNTASRLGEDLAETGEILITDNALRKFTGITVTVYLTPKYPALNTQNLQCTEHRETATGDFARRPLAHG